MRDAMTVSTSGMDAARTTFDLAAHSVANASTEGFQPARAELAADEPRRGVRVEAVTQLPPAPAGAPLVDAITGMELSGAVLRANITAYRVADDTRGSVIDLRAS
jgi:hypothetical protein